MVKNIPNLVKDRGRVKVSEHIKAKPPKNKDKEILKAFIKLFIDLIPHSN